jgi:hypothetical protein
MSHNSDDVDASAETRPVVDGSSFVADRVAGLFAWQGRRGNFRLDQSNQPHLEQTPAAKLAEIVAATG